MMRASSLLQSLCPSRFLLLAAALLALAVLLAQDGLPIAHAQQTTAYVSNTGQAAAQQRFRLSTAATAYAQGFTTGSQTGGYTLGSIDLVIANAPNQGQRDTIRAELWSAVASGNNAGEPNAKLSDLTVPAHPISAGTVRFTAPANTTLSASTTYFLMVYSTETFDVSVEVTSETDEDTGAATGWSINDRVHEPSTGSNTNTPSEVSAWRVGGDTNIIAQIGVNPPAATAPSSLQATAIAGGVRLSWNAPADPAGVITGYEVLRRKSSQSRMRPYVVDTGSTDTSYTDNGAAKQGETYTYQVKAKGVSWNTEASNSAAVTIPGRCPISGGSPVDIPTSEVPIVVTSTADDYFALYVLHDVQGNTVELPVLVKLGEPGTTTLADNLAPLPAEKYRVKKYQVAKPADVDGDCIDDLTELADLGTKSPVNPAESVDISNGAVSITDHATFQKLSYQGRAVSAVDPDLKDMEYVKFTIISPGSDRPTVYFLNSDTHPWHMSFAEALGFDTSSESPWRNAMMHGELIYHPNVVAPDGSLGVYWFQFRPWDTNENHAFDSVAFTFEVLAASMPFLENNLAYYPANQGTLLLYQKDKALYDASRVNVLLEDDIPKVDFFPLNKGEGYGFLRRMSLDERPNPRDIVIYETLPNNLPRVAGVITTVPQTPLSHVNLRAVQDDIPNAFIRDALDDSDIDDLIGRYVRYTVTRSGYVLRAATRAEVDAHYESSRPASAQTPHRDLSVTKITALSDVGFDDWDAFGVKAANMAVLGTLNFPERTVPGGFAVPFYFYDEFMKNAVLAEETLFGKKKWDDDDKFTMAAGTKLNAVVTAMLAHRKFQTDYEVQEEMLDDLRDAIKDAESPQWIIDALTAMHATYPEGQSLRYRSSTNNEDLPGFSGAGLYDSKTQDPDETEEDGIDKSIKGVWASLWNFRAFVERDFHRVDHTRTAMGVLVHPNYSDELANGVAVSFDPFSGREDAYYVNTQLGEDLVTNPEAHSTPEAILLLPDGSYEVLAYSNQKEPRGPLMSDAQMSQLRRHLTVIHDRFAALYQPAPGEPFAMEIEFKITSANKLSIKQARPWVFQRQLNRPPTVVSPLPDISLEGPELRELDLSAVFHDPDGDDLTFTFQVSKGGVAAGWVDGSTLNVGGFGTGTVTITVTAEDPDGNTVSDAFEVSVAPQQQGTPNQTPTVASAISDATIVSESGTRQVSLSGVFTDADGDSLTITAESSAETVATVSVASDYSTLTVTTKSRGTATITVTADDGNGGAVSDTFTVRVKATPVVASGIGDVSGLEEGSSHDVSLSGVFSDADGDSLTITAASSDGAKATVTVAADQSNLSVAGVAEGTATITVTARDVDGNRVSDAFEAPVAKRYASLIAKIKEWRNAPCCVNDKAHTDRWDRTLLVFGEGVADTTLSPMTSDEAQGYADRGWTRWVEVTAALREIESGGQDDTPNQAPTVASAIADATIVNESETLEVSLSGVFSDADNDALTATASSSNEAVATVSVTVDHTTLTVNARSRGEAEITVTASDGNGGNVSDTFTVRVKAAPVVGSALSDVSELEADALQDVSLSGVFSDADGDLLTITAASSDEDKATATVAADQSKLTVAGVAEGAATITVTAQDSDGNRVSDAFDVSVAKKYAALIAKIKEWRNDPRYVNDKAHTDRWDRTLLVFGEGVADTTLSPMTADEAQGYADRGWTRWVEVTAALREIESGGQDDTPNQAPTVASAIADATIVNESETLEVSLSGVFSDADNDALTATASSSNEAVATVSVTVDHTTLTVNARSRGEAEITVTASDGNGGNVSDTFTVRVKAAPVVGSALSDVSELEADATQEVSLSGVFNDADGDSLALSAASSDEAKATVSVAYDGSRLTLAGVAEGTTTITVTAKDSDGNRVSDAFEVEVAKAPEPDNQAPTVSSAITDATIINESGTRQVSLSGVFSDADSDSLTVTAASGDEAVATVSVAADYSTLTVNAQARGEAEITVTADDGNGGTVEDAFTVMVKAAPVVASAIADVSGLEVDATWDVSPAGVFSDADGDSLTITAASSDDATATVTVAADQSKLTVAGVAEGTATITVTARDSDGNAVSDDFAVSVEPEPEDDPAPDEDSPTGPPTVASPLADISLEGPELREIDLSGVFQDPDGDDLTFTAVSSNYGVATTWVDGSTLTVMGTGTGTATITVTAEDPDGNRVSDAFQVTVTPYSQEG